MAEDEIKLYGTYSLRRGAVTDAFRAGVPEKLIKVHGNWKSDCYKRYADVDADDLLRVSAMMP